MFSSMTFRAKAAVISNGEYGENIYWELEDTGVLTISGTGEMPDLAFAVCDLLLAELKSGLTACPKALLFCRCLIIFHGDSPRFSV